MATAKVFDGCRSCCQVPDRRRYGPCCGPGCGRGVRSSVPRIPLQTAQFGGLDFETTPSPRTSLRGRSWSQTPAREMADGCGIRGTVGVGGVVKGLGADEREGASVGKMLSWPGGSAAYVVMRSVGESVAASEPQLTSADVMTAAEVAELLAMPKSTVEEWARQGVLPSRKRGRRRFYLRWEVRAWLVEDD